MRNDKRKMNNKSGGYNVAWLILVQAVVWNILFPVYLLTNGAVLLVLVVAYLAALGVVAKKTIVPVPEFETADELFAYYRSHPSKLEQFEIFKRELPTATKSRVVEIISKLKPKSQVHTISELYN